MDPQLQAAAGSSYMIVHAVLKGRQEPQSRVPLLPLLLFIYSPCCNVVAGE